MKTRPLEQQPLNLTFDTTPEVLWTIVNVMQRCDENYCNAHQQEPCTDDEWNAALQLAEDELEKLGMYPHPARDA